MKAHIFLMACSLLLFISCQDSVETPTEVLLPETKATLSPDERFGALFETVQLARIFPHSKTFSDCIPKQSTDQILQAYELRRSAHDFDRFLLENIFPVPTKREFNSKGIPIEVFSNTSMPIGPF